MFVVVCVCVCMREFFSCIIDVAVHMGALRFQPESRSDRRVCSGFCASDQSISKTSQSKRVDEASRAEREGGRGAAAAT